MIQNPTSLLAYNKFNDKGSQGIVLDILYKEH